MTGSLTKNTLGKDEEVSKIVYRREADIQTD